MEVHRQTCQSCGRRDLHNYILRQPGNRQVVLASCRHCGQLVARYELSGYYHHEKGFDEWLRTTAVATESTIDLRETFDSLKKTAALEYDLVRDILKKQNKEL